MAVYILALLTSFMGWQKLQQQQQQHHCPANISNNNIRSRVLSLLLSLMEKALLMCHPKSGFTKQNTPQIILYRDKQLLKLIY